MVDVLGWASQGVYRNAIIVDKKCVYDQEEILLC